MWYFCYDLLLLPPPKEVTFSLRSVCLFRPICPSDKDNWNKLWTDFDEISWRGRAWPRDQWVQFWWRSGSPSGPGVRSPKSAVTGLSKKLPTDFGEILWRAGVWPRDQLITFWWRSASLSGSGSPFRITIRIGKNCRNSIMLAFGGGLCSLSTSSCYYDHYLRQVRWYSDLVSLLVGWFVRSLRSLWFLENYKSDFHELWQFRKSRSNFKVKTAALKFFQSYWLGRMKYDFPTKFKMAAWWRFGLHSLWLRAFWLLLLLFCFLYILLLLQKHVPRLSSQSWFCLTRLST